MPGLHTVGVHPRNLERSFIRLASFSRLAFRFKEEAEEGESFGVVLACDFQLFQVFAESGDGGARDVGCDFPCGWEGGGGVVG